jgi:hypothetical protein
MNKGLKILNQGGNLTMLFRSFLEMCSNVNTHTHYQGNNYNFGNNNKQYWINIHSLFIHQANTIKPTVATPFNIITKGRYWSIGKKSEAQRTPNVTWESAIKTCINRSLSRLLNFIATFIFSQQIESKINGQIDIKEVSFLNLKWKLL